MTLTELYAKLENKLLELFEQYTPQAIQAGQNLEPSPQLSDTDIESLNTEIVEIHEEILTLAQEGIEEPVTDNVEIDPAVAIVSIFAIKSVIDGLRRVHSATVARQVEDKEEAVKSSIETTENAIEGNSVSEVGTSLGEIQETIATDSGYGYYRYLTSQDEVVRSTHASRNGKIFKYGSAREAADVPHREYRCRCQAEPLTEAEAIADGDFFYSEDNPSIESSTNKGNIPIMSNKLSITAKGESLDITGYIDWWDENDIQSIKRKVNSNSKEDLHLNITSHGGDGMDGIAMYSFFKSLDRKVIANVYGYAGSAATGALMASSHSTIGESDMVLIHNAAGGAQGSSDDLRGMADWIDAVTDQYVKAYKSKTGRSEEEIRSLMDEDRYISAQEALDFGLVDEIRKDNYISANARKGVTEKGDFIIAANARLPDDESEDEMTAKLKEEIQQLTDQLAEKDTLIAASSKQIEKLEKDAKAIKTEDEIRADERAKIEASAKKIEDARKEINDLGMEAKGETRREILANAMISKGYDVSDEDKDEVIEALFKATSSKMTDSAQLFDDLSGKTKNNKVEVLTMSQMEAKRKEAK